MKIIRFKADPSPLSKAPASAIQRGKSYWEIDTETGKQTLLLQGKFEPTLNPQCTIFLRDRMWFGKYNMYEGCRLNIRWICENDPDYIDYMQTNHLVQISQEVLKYVDQQKHLGV